MEEEKIHTKFDLKIAYSAGLTQGDYEANLPTEYFEEWYKKAFKDLTPIPFDLELYETRGYDCVTREGNKARFLNKIYSINYPLVFAIINKIGEEYVFTYSIYGGINNFMSNKFNSEGSPNDIFLIPKP